MTNPNLFYSRPEWQRRRLEALMKAQFIYNEGGNTMRYNEEIIAMMASMEGEQLDEFLDALIKEDIIDEDLASLLIEQVKLYHLLRDSRNVNAIRGAYEVFRFHHPAKQTEDHCNCL